MATQMNDLVTSLEALVQNVAGASYKKLAYLENIEKNNYRTNKERYGVRALVSSEVPGVTKFVTYTQPFEIVLSKGYYQSNVDDSEQIQSGLDNRALILDIYKEAVNTKAGLPSVVMNITDLIIELPEYIEEEKVAVQRATMNITYRLTLL